MKSLSTAKVKCNYGVPISNPVVRKFSNLEAKTIYKTQRNVKLFWRLGLNLCTAITTYTLLHITFLIEFNIFFIFKYNIFKLKSLNLLRYTVGSGDNESVTNYNAGTSTTSDFLCVQFFSKFSFKTCELLVFSTCY